MTLRKPSKVEPESKNYGESVTRTCNRKFHYSQFYAFFNKNVTTCLGRPQFFLVHGEANQGHISFIERLKSTHIKEYVDKEFPLEKAIIKHEEIDWPEDGDFDLRCEHLQSNLFTTFDKSYFSTDFTVNTFAKLSCFGSSPLVIVQHDFNSESWDETSSELLRWYVKNYWHEFKSRDNVPQFVIFFCLIYKKEEQAGLITRLLKQPNHAKEILSSIKDVFEEKDTECPGKIIKELTSPKLREVKDWLKHHKLCMNEILQQKIIEKIFGISYEDDYELCMAEIELKLDEIIVYLTNEKRNFI